MHRGRDIELQELGTEEYMVRGGEREPMDIPFICVPTLEGDGQVCLRPRQNPSSAAYDMSAASMIREDRMQSQTGMDEIGAEDLTTWFRIREEYERMDAQMRVEKDEWAMSRTGGTG